MPDPIEDAITADEAAADSKNPWTKGAIVVANGPIPTGATVPVVVCETRGDDGVLDADRKYPAGADLYYRTPDGAEFGKLGPVVELAKDVEQGQTAGFSDHPAFVNVGPASPIYAAANLAYIRGARRIEITGLTPTQKTNLTPWFDIVQKGGPMQGAAGVLHDMPVNSVKIILT